MHLAGKSLLKKAVGVAGGCVLALLLVGQPAYPLTVTVLDENFDDVTGLGSASTTRTVADILTNNPAQLPAGTFWTAASASNINVRRGDNSSNTSTATSGLDSFFSPTSTNRFLVIGDNSGAIGDDPTGGIMTVFFPLYIPGGAESITVGFDYAFDGFDNNTSASDPFSVYLTDMFNPTFSLLLITSPNRTSGSPGNIAQGSFSGTYLMSDLSGFDLEQMYLAFRLDERASNTNTAGGIDNILVTAVVPEPSTILLLGSGILALGFYGARRRNGR